MATFSTTIDGVIYNMGHHGVVSFDGGPDFLPGFRTVEFADYDVTRAVQRQAIDAGVRFCNPPPRF